MLRSTYFLTVKLRVSARPFSMSSADRLLQYEVRLPFAPFPGLVITNTGSLDDLRGEITCSDIYYDVFRQGFITHIVDTSAIASRDPNEWPARVSEVVNEYLESGWSLMPEDLTNR